MKCFSRSLACLLVSPHWNNIRTAENFDPNTSLSTRTKAVQGKTAMFAWELQDMHNMTKVRPRLSRSRAVTHLHTPMQLICTLDSLQFRSQMQGIDCISTGNSSVHSHSECYTVDLKFWTEDNDLYPSYWIGVCLPKTWSPQMYLAAVQHTLTMRKEIFIGEVCNPLAPHQIILTVNNVAQLYFKLPQSTDLHFRFCNELCIVDGGTKNPSKKWYMTWSEKRFL